MARAPKPEKDRTETAPTLCGWTPKKNCRLGPTGAAVTGEPAPDGVPKLPVRLASTCPAASRSAAVRETGVLPCGSFTKVLSFGAAAADELPQAVPARRCCQGDVRDMGKAFLV
jgi:hypothetical protein